MSLLSRSPRHGGGGWSSGFSSGKVQKKDVNIELMQQAPERPTRQYRRVVGSRRLTKVTQIRIFHWRTCPTSFSLFFFLLLVSSSAWLRSKNNSRYQCSGRQRIYYCILRLKFSVTSKTNNHIMIIAGWITSWYITAFLPICYCFRSSYCYCACITSVFEPARRPASVRNTLVPASWAHLL